MCLVEYEYEKDVVCIYESSLLDCAEMPRNELHLSFDIILLFFFWCTFLCISKNI